ncbi:MAG: hypothetical protein M3416_04170 [Acidobacteriota bacterium]|nr:hypothetical protein [Acidobacteriota bacterium]
MPKWLGGSTLEPDILMPQQEQWKLQWDRVIRWHNRVDRIKKKSQTSELNAYDIDEVIAFLQNCYHLRDWLQESRPDCRDKVNALFASNFEMTACRDVCNGFKHKRLQRPSHDAHFNLYREYEHFADDGSVNPDKYSIAFADGVDVRKYDLFDFAECCFRLWESFVSTEVPSAPPT